MCIWFTQQEKMPLGDDRKVSINEYTVTWMGIGMAVVQSSREAGHRGREKEEQINSRLYEIAIRKHLSVH